MEARLELFVVLRRAARQEVVGAAGLHDLGRQEPEAGIWLKETAPGQGLGPEAMAALIGWAGEACGAAAVVVDVNLRSRWPAERLGGAVAGRRALRKGAVELPEVVYTHPLPGRPRRACADRRGVAGFSLFGGVLALDGVGGHPYYPRTLTGGWR